MVWAFYLHKHAKVGDSSLLFNIYSPILRHKSGFRHNPNVMQRIAGEGNDVGELVFLIVPVIFFS
jgi:hypothetical protein